VIYKAQVCLFIEVENDAEACDAVAEMLRDHIRRFAPESCLVDWRYSTELSHPVEASKDEIADLEYPI